MKVFKFIGRAALSPAALIGKSLLGSKKAQQPVAINPVVTRDDARDRLSLSRGLLRRRGGLDDQLFGGGGVEPGGPLSLGLPGSN